MTLVSMEVSASSIGTIDSQTLSINLTGGGKITLKFRDAGSMAAMAETITQAILDAEEDGVIVKDSSDEESDASSSSDGKEDRSFPRSHDEVSEALESLHVHGDDDSFDEVVETQQLFF